MCVLAALVQANNKMRENSLCIISSHLKYEALRGNLNLVSHLRNKAKGKTHLIFRLKQ
jgi:hypothetical protein